MDSDTETNLRQFNFKMPKRQFQELRRFAFDREIPMSDVIRQAIEEHLEKEQAEQKQGAA